MDEVELDVSPLLAPDKKFAVQVHTKEEAIAFLKFMMKNYPAKTVSWTLSNHHFGRWSTTCYAPWLNKDNSYRLKYCHLQFYQEDGYEIIQFEELIYRELADSDQPLEFLFGGAV